MSVRITSTCRPRSKARYSAAVNATRGVSRRSTAGSLARFRNTTDDESAPVSVVFLVLQVRNLRQVPGDRRGVRLVIAALALRWLTANVLYSLWGRVSNDVWTQLLWVESTVVVLISFLLLGLAVTRTNLFTARSAVGELVLESAFVLVGLLLTGAGVVGAGRLAVTWPRIEQPLLMLSAAVPLLVYVAAARLRPAARVTAATGPPCSARGRTPPGGSDSAAPEWPLGGAWRRSRPASTTASALRRHLAPGRSRRCP